VTSPKTVAIVGGGIAGLAAAFALLERSAEAGVPIACTVLESSPSWGGKIVTHRVGDLVTEAGPDSFLSQKPAALQLIGKLGLTDQLIDTNWTATKACVYSRGRLRELPEGLVLITPGQVGPFLRSGLLSPAGLLRMGMDMVLPARRSAEDESLAAFFRRRFGRQAFERMMEPLMAGIYAGNAEQLSIKATFPKFPELERTHGSVIRGMLSAKADVQSVGRKRTMFVSLKNGLEDLIAALYRSLTDRGLTLRSGTAVESLRVRSHELGRWTYDVMLSEGGALSVDGLILATPAFVSAELLRPLTPIAGGLLERIPYASTATVAMAYPAAAVGRSVQGFGFVVPRVEQRDLIAATWTSLKWPHRAPAGQVLIRCYLGGVGREAVLELDDQSLISRVRGELQRICGLVAEPTYVEVNRWVNAMPQYVLGHLERLDEIERALSRFDGLVLTGSAYRGVGIPDCIRDAWTAADRIVRYLSGERGRGRET
jgi:oxygen-dependent protoporphyrinogen oxidase